MADPDGKETGEPRNPEEMPPASASVPSGSTPTSAQLTLTHCPYRQAALLQQAMAPDKMRVSFFLGAGCPVSIRIPDGDGTRPLIPDIAGLTKQVREKLEASEKHKTAFAAILKRLVDCGKSNPNIEDILTHIRALREVVGKTNHDGLSAETLDGLDAEICKVTVQIMEVRLPTDDSPYHQLATWINAIKREHAVEIFTSNYDLLMEQALEDRHVPYFDGFVGSNRTFFDLPSMEQDGLPSRWARLWKVHGSINWRQTPEGHVERRFALEGERALIHPSHLKYYQSRRMPYLAMLDRLRSFLVEGQAVLVTCGYSFSDKHLNDVILQGLTGNPTAICFGLLFTDRAKFPEAVSHARKHPNLNLLV
ncbi:MAG TPA: SIR2 family protein [Bacteroidota bacterium]|nr:SIR2 family protein [Bacteroidota bacterium]